MAGLRSFRFGPARTAHHHFGRGVRWYRRSRTAKAAMRTSVPEDRRSAIRWEIGRDAVCKQDRSQKASGCSGRRIDLHGDAVLLGATVMAQKRAPGRRGGREDYVAGYQKMKHRGDGGGGGGLLTLLLRFVQVLLQKAFAMAFHVRIRTVLAEMRRNEPLPEMKQRLNHEPALCAEPDAQYHQQECVISDQATHKRQVRAPRKPPSRRTSLPLYIRQSDVRVCEKGNKARPDMTREQLPATSAPQLHPPRSPSTPNPPWLIANRLLVLLTADNSNTHM